MCYEAADRLVVLLEERSLRLLHTKFDLPLVYNLSVDLKQAFSHLGLICVHDQTCYEGVVSSRLAKVRDVEASK